MTDKKKTAELTDTDLDEVSGGIGVGELRPTAQKVRDATTLTSGAELKLKTSPDHIRARTTKVLKRI